MTNDLTGTTALATGGNSGIGRAVALTIQSLERQLGVQLLIRGAGGVTLTGAGTALLREARALIAQHDRVARPRRACRRARPYCAVA